MPGLYHGLRCGNQTAQLPTGDCFTPFWGYFTVYVIYCVFPISPSPNSSQISFPKITSKITCESSVFTSHLNQIFKITSRPQPDLTLQELCLSAYDPARMSYAEYGHLQASAYCAFQRMWHRWEHRWEHRREHRWEPWGCCLGNVTVFDRKPLQMGPKTISNNVK